MARPTLSELDAVAAVARAGGFRAAAREFGSSSSALSHGIAGLEERLGVRLFNRTTRSVALTPAGERFVAEIAPALALIDEAVEHVGDDAVEPTGALRLNIAPAAAQMLLGPFILEYAKRHPRVTIEITTENALVDIVGQGFDAGVRLAETVPPDMVAVPLVPMLRSLVIGSPAYLEEHPAPQKPSDLLHHRCIKARMGSGRIYRWEFEKDGQQQQIDVPGTLVLDESSLMLDAALHGAGLAYISAAAVAANVESGRLVTVLEDWTPPYPGLSLYFPHRRHMPARFRALVALAREFAASASLGRVASAPNCMAEAPASGGLIQPSS